MNKNKENKRNKSHFYKEGKVEEEAKEQNK